MRGGGIPKGIMIEVSGEESVGKTAIIGEVIAAAQFKNPPGEVKVCDSEGRFSKEYQNKLYHRFCDLWDQSKKLTALNNAPCGMW
ncbi:hypothetical protein LCGC14_2645330 [marine sediment metagenome]|uniref:RecA-like N-terminal domain-containing protein n=1 Tax=marine sediment metagenome TaxID=412755 RepID=A0A0F8ZWD7_9ZZZZ